jgi:hypothetical protein
MDISKYFNTLSKDAMVNTYIPRENRKIINNMKDAFA